LKKHGQEVEQTISTKFQMRQGKPGLCVRHHVFISCLAVMEVLQMKVAAAQSAQPAASSAAVASH
jgi:hypothetical protein